MQIPGDSSERGAPPVYTAAHVTRGRSRDVLAFRFSRGGQTYTGRACQIFEHPGYLFDQYLRGAGPSARPRAPETARPFDLAVILPAEALPGPTESNVLVLPEADDPSVLCESASSTEAPFAAIGFPGKSASTEPQGVWLEANSRAWDPASSLLEFRSREAGYGIPSGFSGGALVSAQSGNILGMVIAGSTETAMVNIAKAVELQKLSDWVEHVRLLMVPRDDWQWFLAPDPWVDAEAKRCWSGWPYLNLLLEYAETQAASTRTTEIQSFLQRWMREQKSVLNYKKPFRELVTVLLKPVLEAKAWPGFDFDAVWKSADAEIKNTRTYEHTHYSYLESLYLIARLLRLLEEPMGFVPPENQQAAEALLDRVSSRAVNLKPSLRYGYSGASHYTQTVAAAVQAKLAARPSADPYADRGRLGAERLTDLRLTREDALALVYHALYYLLEDLPLANSRDILFRPEAPAD